MDKKKYEQPQVTTETICHDGHILADSMNVYDGETGTQFSRSDNFIWSE